MSRKTKGVLGLCKETHHPLLNPVLTHTVLAGGVWRMVQWLCFGWWPKEVPHMLQQRPPLVGVSVPCAAAPAVVPRPG